MERVCALASIFAACALHAAAPPPVAAYGALPNFDNAELSPDGTRLALLLPRGETQHLTVLDVDAGSNRLVLASDPARFLFNWCRWANEERLVCSVRAYVERVPERLPGQLVVPLQRLTITRLFAVNADGSHFLELVPEAVSRTGRDIEWNSQLQDRVVSWLPEDREHILLALDRETPLRPTVYRLNIYSNRLTRIVRDRPSVRAWYADHHGEVQLGVGYRGTRPMAVVRSGSRFLDVDVSRFATDLTPTPRGFSPDSKSLYLETFHGEQRGIYEVRLADLAVVRPLVVNERFDVYGPLLIDDRSGELLGAVYRQDIPEVVFFDEKLEQMDAQLEQLLPGTVRVPVSVDDTRTRVVFDVRKNGTVPTHYLYDDAEKHLTRIGPRYGDIPPEWVVSIHAVTYRARDGLDIPAYYAVPERESKQLPTVVLPHGGPHARDTAEFDYWVQFLTSRGYAVLKPNFRGSTGYGASFLRGGYGEWGRKMQDDVIDGLDWMIAQGFTDPARVCFVGASYGGYVALTAAFQTPQRIRCAVSFAGVADLPKLIEERWYQKVPGTK